MKTVKGRYLQSMSTECFLRNVEKVLDGGALYQMFTNPSRIAKKDKVLFYPPQINSLKRTKKQGEFFDD